MRAACPSLSYWLRAAAMAPVTAAVLLAVRLYMLRKGARQRAAGYERLEGDVAWTPRTTLLYPLVCSAAGLCAGVFGVGGGIIKVRCPCVHHQYCLAGSLEAQRRTADWPVRSQPPSWLTPFTPTHAGPADAGNGGAARGGGRQ